MFVLLVFIRLSLFIALTFILSLNPHSASEDFKALMRELPVEGPLPESAPTEVETAWQLIRLPWEVPQDWQSAFPQPPPGIRTTDPAQHDSPLHDAEGLRPLELGR